MRNETIVFGFMSAFLYITAAVYALWTTFNSSIEWTGTAALLVAASLVGVCSWYFWIISRRIDPRPEDRAEAQISEGAGVVGSFSPASYWPLGIGLSAALIAIGLALVQIWVAAAGFIAVLFTTAGLLFENYVVKRRG
jgi:cytochrome c oxidase subunit IV